MDWSGIAIFYFACFVFGFLSALISAIFGEIGSHFDFGAGDHAIDFGHGEGISHDLGGGHEVGAGQDIGAGDSSHAPGVGFFNGLTIATLFAFLGIFGLVAVWGLGLSPLVSLAVSLPTALLVAVGEFLLFVNVFVKAQASSEATLSEVLGCEAEVITSIPGDRVGQIAYVIKGSRFTAPAVSADGTDIARNTKVQVVNVRGTMLVVRLR